MGNKLVAIVQRCVTLRKCQALDLGAFQGKTSLGLNAQMALKARVGGGGQSGSA